MATESPNPNQCDIISLKSCKSFDKTYFSHHSMDHSNSGNESFISDSHSSV